MAHVLVIDDDVDVRWVIRRAVQADGHTVSEAGDGDEGLQRFAEQPPDLVITDILMPGREGIETIIELRRRRPELPILAISGGSRHHGARRGARERGPARARRACSQAVRARQAPRGGARDARGEPR
jgi:CheY-like chemotaxis protein